jgi:hypothetical protein
MDCLRVERSRRRLRPRKYALGVGEREIHGVRIALELLNLRNGRRMAGLVRLEKLLACLRNRSKLALGGSERVDAELG